MAGKVRILKEKLFKVKKDDTKLLYVEGACDNDATPPQGNFVTGSAFENVTSGNKYKYSETSGDWVLQPNEGGTGGGVLVVGIDMDTMTLDKTWNEINSAPFVVLRVQADNNIVQYNSIISCSYYADTGNHYVEFASISQDGTAIVQFHTNSADGYPVLVS